MKLISQEKKEANYYLPLRRAVSFTNKIYNHFLGININHSFRSKSEIEKITIAAQHSLQKLLEPTSNTLPPSEISKKIWIFWDKGFENAPQVAKLSLKSWQKMNPEYEVIVLSNDNLENYLGFDFHAIFQLASVRCLLPTKADLLRLHLLSKYGGVWVDATTFCLKPLSDWLPEAIEKYGFFTFIHKYDVSAPVEAWFICSYKGNQIINDVLQSMVDYIFKPRELTLFVSGKALIEKNHPFGYELLEQGEKIGFMPYFSIGYCFYEALNKYLSEQEVSAFIAIKSEFRMSNNNFAAKKDNVQIFKHSFVSKQTYTRRYLTSKLFESRKAYLKEKLLLLND